MTAFDGLRESWEADDRPARVPRRSLLLRARDIAGVALVAVNAVVWPFLLWAFLEAIR
jgi:hypothetical protein